LGANKKCNDCHDLTLQHINGVNDEGFAGQRIKDTINTVIGINTVTSACNACHQTAQGIPAIQQVLTHTNQNSGAEQPFSKGCEVCHEVHGSNKNINNQRNLKMVKSTINTSSVVFISTTNTDSFDELDIVDINDTDDVCVTCHRNSLNNPGYPMQFHIGGKHDGGGMGTDERGNNCTTSCHKHSFGFMHGGGGGTGCGTSNTCHGLQKSHSTHVSGTILSLDCSECHNTNSFPQFRDGANSKATTTVCNNCHSANGVFLAKQYFSYPGSSANTAGSWANVEGQQSFCGSCHDSTPGNTKGDGTGDTAINMLGDNATYGFYVTGHGKASGNYSKLSWQDTTATSNPAANRKCNDCHNLQSAHFNNAQKRLTVANDQSNSNCNTCHPPGIVATSNPQWYINSSDFENSAHKNKLCSECHDVHGVIGPYTAMTKGDKQTLCYQCHSATGGVVNNAISGSSVATNIQDAFNLGNKHSLGTGFDIKDSQGNIVKSYKLQCVSCHNVHTITGRYTDAANGKTPITRFGEDAQGNQRNIVPYGDKAGEKMKDFGGTYRTPIGDLFSKDQLPNYAQFCLDCHELMPDPAEQPGAHGNIQYDDRDVDPHGLNSANLSNGEAGVPNWITAGFADNWKLDDALNPTGTSWPVRPSGRGSEAWTLVPYNQEDRDAGANFVLSCTDCHEAHGSSNRSMIRPAVNGGTGTDLWTYDTYYGGEVNMDGLCGKCHSYWTDWHAGMMHCWGSYGCHGPSSRQVATGTNSIHQMVARGEPGHTYNGATKIWNPDLISEMKLENNLRDSGTWNMHGRWYGYWGNLYPATDPAGIGSYIAGKVGQAVSLNGDQPIEIGTENDKWSTDEGYHGTWKYSEMKYHTTIETWAKPTSDIANEYIIATKHVGYDNGSYRLALEKINGTLRAVLRINVNGDPTGTRGAYSSVGILLNKWTHIAATFDTNGPDRDTSNPSIGRIRIYVNGEDVTWSNISSSDQLRQPGAGEDYIYPYSQHSNSGDNTWEGSAFSWGGYM
jgi:predicted CXXCH cytochrome family protein